MWYHQEKGLLSDPDTRCVAAIHQFLNFIEQQIQVWKGLMASMNRSQNKSIYNQEDTMLDLQEKISMAYKAMSLRPILIKHKG